MAPTCPNLKSLYGRRYRVAYEESYYAEYGPDARTEEPWLMIIPCKYGTICPWDETRLAACTDRAGRIAARLRAMTSIEIVQEGDDGVNAAFTPDQFDAVAEIMRPKRRRYLTPQQRADAVERLRRYWPEKGQFGARPIDSGTDTPHTRPPEPDMV
jgi:hypothetical protein